jgi:hypothetical protein
MTQNEASWISFIIKKYNLKPYYLTPFYGRKTVRDWGGLRETEKRAERAARWPMEADPNYAIKMVITENAIGWNEEGKLMFLFIKSETLQETIAQPMPTDALAALQALDFKSCDDSKRPELKRANDFNGSNAPVRAEELNLGYGADRRIYGFVETALQMPEYSKLFETLHWMSGVYQKTLPQHFRLQNTKIKTMFRQGISVFSSVALLKSAPSAVHVDSRNGDSFACMTTVDTPAGYKGGTFCFVQYCTSIAVGPGDILIATTPRDWHCNIAPVVGEKYSIVAYYKQALHSPGLFNKYQVKVAEMNTLSLGAGA